MKTVKPRSLFGKLTRRQKASIKKFRGKVRVVLGKEKDKYGNERQISRQIDIYFDDISEVLDLIYTWKYESWMDMKEKFDGTECRGWVMEFGSFPLVSLVPSRGDGRNDNKSFRGSVTDLEVREVFSEYSNIYLTTTLYSRWKTMGG